MLQVKCKEGIKFLVMVQFLVVPLTVSPEEQFQTQNSVPKYPSMIFYT